MTNYLWDEASANGDVAVETDVSHTPQARYILGNGQLVAQEGNGATSFYLQDGQQNVRALTDTTGNQTDSYLYDAYGNLQNRTGTTSNPYQYTGQQFDNLTGLYNLRARNYDPSVGRFLNQDSAALDTSNPLELNRYVYTADNPVTSFDPSGHQALAEWGLNVRQQRITAATLGGGAAGFASSIFLVAATKLGFCGNVDFSQFGGELGFIAEATGEGAVFGFSVSVVALLPVVGPTLGLLALGGGLLSVALPSPFSLGCRLLSMAISYGVGGVLYGGLTSKPPLSDPELLAGGSQNSTTSNTGLLPETSPNPTHETMLDVGAGANIRGEVIPLSNAFPNSTILVVEPLSDQANLLTQFVSRLNLTNVSVSQNSIGNDLTAIIGGRATRLFAILPNSDALHAITTGIDTNLAPGSEIYMVIDVNVIKVLSFDQSFNNLLSKITLYPGYPKYITSVSDTISTGLNIAFNTGHPFPGGYQVFWGTVK